MFEVGRICWLGSSIFSIENFGIKGYYFKFKKQKRSRGPKEGGGIGGTRAREKIVCV